MRRLDAGAVPLPRLLDEVAATVREGGVVVFPTDTVYGIGADPMRPEAIARIYALKGRPAEKPLVLHFGTVAECAEYLGEDALARRIAEATLPGPLTLVVRRPSFVDPRVCSGGETIGLRVPDHPLAAALLDRCGPLAATSANRSGSAAYAGEGSAALLPEADLFIDAGPAAWRLPSTIVDLVSVPPRLVRVGALVPERLAALLPDLPLPAAAGDPIGGPD